MFSHWLFFYEGDLSWWVYLGVIFHGGSILGWSFMMVVSYEVVSPVCTHVCVCVCVCARACVRACVCDNFVYCKPEEDTIEISTGHSYSYYHTQVTYFKLLK